MGIEGISRRCQNINLNCNGPLPKIKIIRHKQKTVTGGHSGWFIEHHSETNEAIPPELTAQEQADIELKIIEAKRENDLRKQLEMAHTQRARLQETLMKRRKAFQTITDNKGLKKRERNGAITLPKALSTEELDLQDLPVQRGYQLLDEPYTLSQLYYEKEPITVIDENELAAMNEKEIRTTYRMGVVDEIRRRSHGKEMEEVRKYYAALELENMKKLKSKKKSVYSPSKYK